MPVSGKKIFNSLKSPFQKISAVSILEVPELSEYGILSCAEGELGTPYEMVRIAGSERQHITLWFMLEGELRFETGGRIFHAGPGDLVIQNSALDRKCAIDRGTFRHVFFSLAGRSSPPGVVKAKFTEEVRNIVRMLRRESLIRPDDPRRKKLLAELLHHYLLRELSAGEERTVVEQLVGKIESDIRHPWTGAVLAEELGLSVSGLYQKCIAQSGRSPSDLIRGIKCRRAQFLLAGTDMKLEEIAWETGYANAYAFSNAFFKQTGIRPGSARKKLRG